jgi:CheY-like chemotaxis protein
MISDHSRILIVDDNENIRDVLEEILVLEGYEVYSCSHAEEALDQAKTVLPDLFLLDIRLPNIDGIELCRILKKDPTTSSIPIIFISGLLGMEEKVRGFNAGAADYITKPFHNLDVLIRVNTHLMLRKNALQLKSMNDDLEQKIEERTAELRVALDMAEEANHAKSDFLSNINHEMRTPLNGVLGMLKLMGTLPMDDDMEMYHSLAEFSARQLSAVISDILEYTQLDAGSMKLRYTSFSLYECLNKVCLLQKTHAENKGLDLSWTLPDAPAFFVSDEIRLVQIVSNLLINAIKYSVSGAITLRCTLTEVLKIEVRDQGPGIPESRIEDIFKPFIQLESPYTKEHNGTGLGLAICRSLSLALGGSLELESREGEGSCFTLILPRQKEEPGKTDQQSKDILPLERPPLILVVEDDTINLYLLEQILESRGWEVLQAMNGEEALEELNSSQPDLILLDMGLPKKSGYEVLKEVRSMGQYDDLPIVAVTAYSHKEDLERFEAAGINDVITKPISEEALFQSISRLLALGKH